MMRGAIQICVLMGVVFILVNGDVFQLAPTSSDSLLLGCYSYGPDNNSTKQVLSTLSTNKTEMSCIEACATSAFKIALSNDSLCICSHDNITSKINITDCNQTHVTLTGNDVSKIYLHVYNTSRLLPGYCEVFDEVRFQIPPMVTLNITKNHEVELDFGDGNVYNLSNRIYNTSYVSHRYLKSGHYRVMLRSKSHNGSGCHAYRDVIVQQGVVVQGMSCPSHVETMATILCRMDVLTGSNMTVDPETVNQKNARIKQEFQLQDIEMVSVGNLRAEVSSQVNSSLDDQQGGTYVIPGERFHTTTVLQAWEIFATSNCSAKLQVFRPTRQSNCSMSCALSTLLCKKWSLLSNDNCNEVCLQIRSCNTNKNCILNNSSFETIFSLDVSLNPGYNFISVPNSMKAILVEFGDVLGWASNDSQCIQAIQGQNHNHEVLYSSFASSWKPFSTRGNVTRKNVSFALRVHGFVPMDVSFTFCHSQAEIISVRSKIRNLISTVERFNETVIVQVPVSGTWYRIDDFMVVNESREVIIKADKGTNLTCILKLPNRDIVYSPFINGNQTEGLDYHVMVTFHKSEVVGISFKISNLVSEKYVSKSTTVRIQVKGLRASIKYAEFAYQNAETFYNASILQGNFVEYHWIFEDPKKPYVNKSTTASHIFQNLGKFKATLYAHNSASYEGATIPTLVIPNPLSIQIPLYVKAGVPQALGCQVLWPEGTPQSFYQKFNLSARKGADVPEKIDTILDFGDGKTMLKNSSVELVHHTFASDKNKAKNIKCTVQNHPELNIKKSVTVLDAISGVQIHTNCSRNISIGTMCNFEAKFTGDLGQCRWAINDKDDTFFPSGNCAIDYKFERANEYEVSVNVSNQVSSLFENSTFVVSRHHISATATTATSIYPTKTIVMETATLATLNISATSIDVTSAVVMETSSISPSTTYILISSVTPNLTILVSRRPISAVATTTTSIYPTKTIVMETATLATLNISATSIDVTSAVVMETSSISPSTTYILISSVTPNLTILVSRRPISAVATTTTSIYPTKTIVMETATLATLNISATSIDVTSAVVMETSSISPSTTYILISSVTPNLTILVSRRPISAVATTTTSIYPTKTIVMETATLATLDISATSMPEVTSAVVMETSSISPSTTNILISSITPNLTVPDLILVCPNYGAVGKEVVFEAYLTSGAPLSYSWKIDTSVLSKARRRLYHVFKSPDIYSVTSEVTSSNGNLSRTCRVTVQELVKGFRITRLELRKDLKVEIGFEVLRGTNVTYEVDFGEEGVPKAKELLNSSPSIISLIHQYKTPRQYTISIHISSMVGPNKTINSTLLVVDGSCTIHDVTIEGGSRDSSSAPIILPQYEYSVATRVNASCDAAGTFSYTWMISNVANESTAETMVKIPEEVSLDGRELVLPSYTLPYGLNKLIAMVKVNPHGISKSVIGYVKVREPDLVALIDCGHVRTVSREREVVFNASRSYDPGTSATDSSSLFFKWSSNCKGNDSWIGDDISRNNSILYIPKMRLSNGECSFLVEVTKDTRKASAKQTINVVDGNFHSLCFRCIQNCDKKVHLNKAVVFLSTTCQENKNLSCTWKLTQSSGHNVKKRSLPFESYKFVISQGDFKPNHTYTVSLEAIINGVTLSNDYRLKTDNVPEGGACSISPSHGKVIETTFQIKCNGWGDEDSPLWYEYYYIDPDTGPTMMAYGWQPQSPLLYLPNGQESENYTLGLYVDIVDVLGSRKRVPLHATVMGFSKDDGPIGAILNSYVNGPSSILEDMYNRGDDQQAIQFMTTISSVLNEDSLAQTESKGQGERVKVRTTLTKEFSNKTISSFPSLRQVLGGLRSATKITNEVTSDAQVYGAKGYENMAMTLAKKHVHKPIEKEADAIVKGLSDVLESSKMTSNKARNDEKMQIDWMDNSNAIKNQEMLRKSQQAATTCLNGADQTARALVRRKKPGDSPSLVQSGNLEIAVQRQPTSDVGGMNLDRTGSTFTLPSDGIQDKTKGFEFVDAKVLTVKESPFPNQGPTPINSQVSSLELQDPSGNPIPINNLSKPISISLNNAKTPEVQSNISGVMDHEGCINITVYKIRVMEEDASIYLEANCSSQDTKHDSHCILMWRKNKHPDFLEHDHSWKISQMNGTFKTLLTSEMFNGTGDYFLGISRDRSRNISCDEKRNASVIFNVTVNVVNCLYWDEGKQNWSNTGCQVGPQTNQHRIHCLCNHLTWFGSKIFIPPNSLDLEKIALRISDPSYYLPVLAVLCTIWLVYALAILWARRADKRDVLKTEVMISPSNQPGNKYIYEVAVTTGIRRHAGTTANTAIMIYGELHDSEPYLLTDNASHRTLQRGTASSFLLTTKESLGPLLHIRIWHDNKGKDPALFLKHIVVRDIQTGEISHFLCNRWFAVDEGDGMIDRVLPITSEEEMAQFSQMFLAKTKKDLTDSHLWFSVIWRPPHSPFTRVQRVSCCLSLLLCTMMANAMWYEKDKGSYTAVDLGPFQFSWEQISIGIMSSLVVFPINLILVQIFRHSKLRRSPDIPKKQQKADSNKVTPMKLVPTFMPSSYHPLKNERSSSLQLSQMEQEGCKNHNSLKHPRAGFLPLRLAAVFVIPRISKSSKQVESSREDCCNNLIAPSMKEEERKETKRKAFRGLPYWCSYIGWAGIAVTSLTSTAVTLMYGIEFGRRTSEKWLFSMFVSVTQDIFVSQPLKVIVFAVIFAFIIKKPNLNDHSDKESDMGKRQRLTQSQSMHCTTIQAPCVPVTIPSEDTLEMARKKRFQEKQMAVILSDIVTYMFFLLIILLISYGQRDKSSFLQKESVEGLVMRTNYSGLSKGYRPDQFQKASKVADVWQWLENVLLPIMYNIQWYYYTGRPTPFIDGGSGMSVGVARLRQLRIKKGGCQVPDGASFLLTKCTMPYSMTSEDENSYLPGWVATNTSNPSHDPLWHYSSATQLRGFPVIGNIETYSGGGYVLKFSPIYYKALQQIHKAKDQLWIDKFSKAVFVEFNLYNPSSNLFTACIVLIEFMQSGGFTIKHEFLTYRLYRYVGDFQLFVVAMEVFFLLFVTYFTYREGKSIYKNRCQYFKSSWVWIEIIIIILSWVTIAHYFICFGIRKWTLQQYLSDPSNFTNFHYISTWQQVFENFMALTVFVAFFKIIKLLNFNKRMYILAHTLKHAAKDLGSYWCIFLLVFFAFSQLYFLMLGSEYLSFSTFIRSMEKLLSVILGKFSFEEFMNPFRILGAITFILYMIVMKFLLLNILIVLVISSFQEVKQSNKKLKNDFEIVDFMVEQLKALSGMRFLNKRGFTMDRTDTISESISDRENQTFDSSHAHGQLNELLLRVDKLESLLMEQDYCDTFDELLYKYLCVHRRGKTLVKENDARKKTFGDRLEITKTRI